MSAQKWDYVAHLRQSDNADVIEITGVFIGSFLQAFDHIQNLSRIHGGVVVNHSITSRDGSKQKVTCITKAVKAKENPVEQAPLALPPPPAAPAATPEPPSLPEGCVEVETITYQVEEFTTHANPKQDTDAPAGRTVH